MYRNALILMGFPAAYFQSFTKISKIYGTFVVRFQNFFVSLPP